MQYKCNRKKVCTLKIYIDPKESEKINQCVPIGVDINNTGFGYTMSLISGKYK